MNSKAQSSSKTKSNAKDRSDNEQSRKSVSLDRKSKGEIQLQNKFESFSDESDMEFVDSHDHPRASGSTWSPILPPKLPVFFIFLFNLKIDNDF